MPARILISIALASLSAFLQAGGIRDSIFELPRVEVRADRIHSMDFAGMKITRIDSTLLMQKHQRALSDLLSENSPVFIKNYGRGALATASFRGTSASHTQLHWNGLPINDPTTGMADFSLIPAFMIDNLELLHGNASMVDQGGGLGGSIHARNVPDWENSFNIGYTQTLGSFSSFGEYLKLGTGNHQIQYRIRLFHDQSANNYSYVNKTVGFFDDGVLIHPTDTNKNADYTHYGFLQELYFKPAQKHIFSVRYWSQWADRGIPRVISYEGPANALVSRQADTDHRAVAEWIYFVNNGRLLMRAGSSFKHMDFFISNQAEGNNTISLLFSQSRQKNFLGNASYKHYVNDCFTVEGKIDWNHHIISSRDTIGGTGYEKRRTQHAYLIAMRKRLFENLNMNLMLRHALTDDRFTPLTPFAGIDWQVHGLPELMVHANVSRNYKEPDMNALYWQPGGNPDLEPEDGISVEAGVNYAQQYKKHRVRGSITAYYSDINNWIIWLPGAFGYWQPFNMQKVLSKGLETDAQIQGGIGSFAYQAVAGYAFTHTVNNGDPAVWGDNAHGKQLVYIPKHSGNLMVQFDYRNWWFSWQYNAYSERYTTSSNDISRRDWLYPYYMNDVSLGRRFEFNRFHISATLRVYNFFNETYHTVLYRPMPGRNFSFVLMLDI